MRSEEREFKPALAHNKSRFSTLSNPSSPAHRLTPSVYSLLATRYSLLSKMKIRQISVFLENRPGRLSVLCRTLAEAGVNLSTLTLAETGEFGLLRIITPDTDKTLQALESAGYAAATSEVVAIQVPDRPGGLASVLAALDPQKISVEYMYAFAHRTGQDAIMIFRFGNLDRAIPALQEAGFGVCAPVDLFSISPR